MVRREIPLAVFNENHAGDGAPDLVNFDDEKGGRQAARHFLNLGHRKIAFLGLNSHQEKDELFPWPARRETGWGRMMREAGQETEGLVFRPAERALYRNDLEQSSQIAMAYETSRQLVRTPGVTAVIAANANAAEGLLQALRASSMPHQRWPAIICSDVLTNSPSFAINYLPLP